MEGNAKNSSTSPVTPPEFRLHPEEELLAPAIPSARQTETSPENVNPFDQITIPSTSRVKQVWAVGGGKGGVGKSLIASSLAITLARMGHRVVAIDLDLGGANLHTTLGVDLPRQTLSDFISGRTQKLDECVTPTGIHNLDLISGAQDSVSITNLKTQEKINILQNLREIDADYIVVDLGAGSSQHTIDFFLYADLGIITLLPEPTSIENAYRFIKTAYYRRLALSRKLEPVHELIDLAMDSKNSAGIKSPSDLFREVNRASPEAGMRLKEEIEKFRPKLLLNQARTQTDVDIGFSVKTVCKKYFGIEMDYVGYLDYDSAVWQAVRRKRPLMLEFPNSKLVASLERVAQYLLKRHGQTRNDIFG
jgi:flagellar biosynthesis protein FlhG